MKPHNRRKRNTSKKTPQVSEVIYLVNRKAEVVKCQIDDPYFNRAHGEVRGNSRKTEAWHNIKESPCRWYESRGWISEDQAAAANRFRSLYERCAGSGLMAMDTSKEPVDGGFMSDNLTDARMDAAKELSAAHDKLGREGYRLVEQVCGHLIWIKQLSSTDYESRRMMGWLRDSLTTLSIYWGYQTTGRARNMRGVARSTLG